MKHNLIITDPTTAQIWIMLTIKQSGGGSSLGSVDSHFSGGDLTQ